MELKRDHHTGKLSPEKQEVVDILGDFVKEGKIKFKRPGRQSPVPGESPDPSKVR